MKKRIEKLLNNRLFYVLLTLGLVIVSIENVYTTRSSKYTIDDTTFIGVLTELKMDETKLVFTIENDEELKCNYYPSEEEIKEDYRKVYRLGSTVSIEGSLKIPSNNTVPNNFNYKKYLYNRKVYYTCTIEKIDVTDEDIPPLYRLKNAITDRIMSFEIRDYMYTLIIGDKSLLDDETFENYRKNGVTHLFAISGMHIGLFSGVVLKLLTRFKIKKKVKYSICILILWVYAFLTGFTPSVLRACLFFTILNGFRLAKIEISNLKILFLTASILILCNRNIIFDIGFIYSFATSFGLIYTSKFLNSHPVLGTSLTATLYSLPITVQNFYKINLLSTLFNLIFVPFVSVIVYPLCLLTFLFRPLEPIAKMAIFFLEGLNGFLAGIDFLYIVVPKLPWIIIGIYFLILLKGFDTKPFRTCTVLLSLILLCKCIPYLNGSYTLGFIDVGQGDSSLLITPHANKVILIDTGGKVSFGGNFSYYVSDSTITYLNSLGLDRVDTLILTHGDYDHMGDALNIVNKLKVGEVIFNGGEYDDLELELIGVLKEKGIDYSQGIEELSIGRGNNLQFINDKMYDNENDNSNVIYAELFESRILLMGDASKEVERNILEKHEITDIDILKVGHHGSNTSSSEEFIDAINPKYSFISVGKNNRYGHPNNEVLDNLGNSRIYRTDEDGSIVLKIKSNKLEIKTFAP